MTYLQRFLIALAFILGLSAFQARSCAAQIQRTAHYLPTMALRYAPLQWYPEWWAGMEKCAGVASPMADWMFVAVYADAFIMYDDPDSVRLVGATLPAKHRLYYVKANLNIQRRVQHEMLHALLYAAAREWRHGTVADSVFKKCNYI